MDAIQRLTGEMMRPIARRFAATVACAATAALGQTHVVKKPDDVVRAVAVYEYTGDEGKATASRVVPVALFINGQFEDAAIYRARPVPLAIDTGTVYEVGKAGAAAGTLELLYERHLTGSETAEIDDGWLGYGQLKLKPKETAVARRQSAANLSINGKESAADSPKLGTRSAAAVPAVDSAEDDPNVPTLHRRAGSGGDATSTAAPAAGASPDTPSPDSNQTASKSASASSSDPDDAAERPTLKRRTAAEIKANQKAKNSARVVAGNDLNDDPDRPSLHRGSKTESIEQQAPPLNGLPVDMKQMVAVSDAKDRPEHNFIRTWESDDERVEVLGKMQEFARQQLREYKGSEPVGSAATSPAAKAGNTASVRAAKRKAAAAAGSVPATALEGENLKGYTLSYGGAATYVYSATSPATNGATRYVSVVAQDVPISGLKVALASVTDSSHLDRTPQMRLVDVVDADASNRASLLMELRAEHTRQFALYRVTGGQADQVFVSGSTQ